MARWRISYCDVAAADSIRMSRRRGSCPLAAAYGYLVPVSGFDLPDGWRDQLGARLAFGGWRNDARRTKSPIMTAAQPSSHGLVVVLELVGYRWPRKSDFLVRVEAGVGVEAAMDLARHLGRSARQGAFFPRNPDLPSPVTECRGVSVADTCGEVERAADVAFVHWSGRFSDVAALDRAMVVQTRLDRTDWVTERAVMLAATGEHQAAVGVLTDAITQADDSDHRQRGWRTGAEQLEQRLRTWIAAGAPLAPPWADQ